MNTNTALAEEVREQRRTLAGRAFVEKAFGDYRVAIALLPPQGRYRWTAGKLEWEEAPGSGRDLAVVVTDAKTGRFVPGIHANVAFIDAKGSRVAAQALEFIWDDEQPHYGGYVDVKPGERYLVQVHLFPPVFARAGRENQARFVNNVDAIFEDVVIESS